MDGYEREQAKAEGDQAAKEEQAAKAAEQAAKAIIVQVMLEEIKVKGKESFVTGTLRISQPEGGELISSKLVDIRVTEDAKIKIEDKDGKLADLKAGMSANLQLVVDQGGLVVVGIQTLGKRNGKKEDEKSTKSKADQPKVASLPKELLAPNGFPAQTLNNDTLRSCAS